MSVCWYVHNTQKTQFSCNYYEDRKGLCVCGMLFKSESFVRMHKTSSHRSLFKTCVVDHYIEVKAS